MDAVAAFLNGEIKDDVFVEQLIGYRVRGKVCKLKKTLYGLRTSPAIWYGILLRIGRVSVAIRVTNTSTTLR
jgi:Reverse transcriptase (RNA-dependent DNA polymerase)